MSPDLVYAALSTHRPQLHAERRSDGFSFWLGPKRTGLESTRIIRVSRRPSSSVTMLKRAVTGRLGDAMDSERPFIGGVPELLAIVDAELTLLAGFTDGAAAGVRSPAAQMEGGVTERKPTSLKKLQDPTAVTAAIEEFERVGRTSFLEKYKFGKSREYMLRDANTGKLYDSKAIVGAAHGYAFPDDGPLRAEDFSGGEATVERVLSELGFEVVRVGQDWTQAEVEATVRAYFEMLRLESLGLAYNKSERNEQLRSELSARSKSSVELKFQNISAVLDQLALPYVRGYKPRANLQTLLRQAVVQFVESHRDSLANVMENFDERTKPGEQQFRGVLVERPKIERNQVAVNRVRLPRKLDYAAREERNRTLGYGGEEWSMNFERTRLLDGARPDLAAKIDWISDRLGDGTGYDILSFETTEVARFVEVKTTNGTSTTPFVVTRNELEFSEEIEDAFCLYRVFDFGVTPRLFILRGPLSSHLELEPIDYRARLRATA